MTLHGRAPNQGAFRPLRLLPFVSAVVGLVLLALALGLPAATPTAAQPAPPATFAGRIDGISPRDGLIVRAEMNGLVCGLATTYVINGSMYYRVHVEAKGGPDYLHCGVFGDPVRFIVDGQEVFPVSGPVYWDAGFKEVNLVAAPAATPTAPLATPQVPSTPSPTNSLPATGGPSDCGVNGYPSAGFEGCGRVSVDYPELVAPAKPTSVSLKAALEEGGALEDFEEALGTSPPCPDAATAETCAVGRPLYTNMTARVSSVPPGLFAAGVEAPRVASDHSPGSWLWTWPVSASAQGGDYVVEVVLETPGTDRLVIKRFGDLAIHVEAASTPTPTATATPTGGGPNNANSLTVTPCQAHRRPVSVRVTTEASRHGLSSQVSLRSPSRGWAPSSGLSSSRS